MSHIASPPASPPPLPESSRAFATSRSRSWLQDAGLVLVVLALGAILSIYGYYDAAPGAKYANTFLNPPNLIDGIASPMSYYAVMAAGMTFVIVSGGIDISVASIMALSAMVTAWALQHFNRDASVLVVLPVSVVLPMLVGLLCGLFNGLLVIGLRLHPFIVTLGTLSIFRGMCNVLFTSATLPEQGKKLPVGAATTFLRKTVFGMEIWPLGVTLVVLAIAHVFLRHTVAGRETYAVGGNEEAARFSGIKVNWVKLRVYALSGLLAGLAGLISLGRFGSVSKDTAKGYELTVVAAAVVGGASLIGGRGTAIGALLGTLILAMIEDGINVMHWNQEYRSIIVGLSILIAVSLDRLSAVIRATRAKRSV